MPTKSIDYSKAIIYKIVCNDLNVKDLYIGSTTHFTNRKALHKHACYNPNSKQYNYKLYSFIRDTGGWANWNMVLVEDYKCNNGNDLRTRERYWYEQLNGTLNKCVPNRSKKESEKQWREQNKEQLKEYNKQYKQQHKEQIKEYNKQYNQQNKEQNKAKAETPYTCICGSTIRTDQKSKHFRTNKHKEYIELHST